MNLMPTKLTPEERKTRQKAWRSTPEVRARVIARRSTPAYKMQQSRWHKAWHSTPEYKAQRAAYYYDMPIEIPNRPIPERCECCGEISVKTLHLDHCHDSGRFRGWCCNGCNVGTGIKDSPKLCRLRAIYLERPWQIGPIQWAYPKNQ